MNTNFIVAILDSEIYRLRQVRDLLSEQGSVSSFAQARPGFASITPKKQGRPVGSKNKTASVANEQESLPRKGLSPEAKDRIAAAQRKRWAKQKSAAKKVVPALTKSAAEKASRSRTSKALPKKKTSAGSKTSASVPLKAASAAKSAPAAKKAMPGKKAPEKKETIATKKAALANSTNKAVGSPRSTSAKKPSKSLASRPTAEQKLTKGTSVATPPDDSIPTAPAPTTSIS